MSVEFSPPPKQAQSPPELDHIGGDAKFGPITKVDGASIWMPIGIIQNRAGGIVRSTLANAIDRTHITDPKDAWNPKVIQHYLESKPIPFISPRKHLVLGFNPDFDNTWHWHLQTLPSLFQALQVLGDSITFLFPKLRSWQVRSLEHLNISHLVCVLGDAYSKLSVERIYLADANCWRDFLKVEITPLTLDLIRRVKSSLLTNNLRRDRRLFVDRSDATRRKIVNVGEVHSLVRDLGFEIINPGQFSYDEQVRMFAEANLVIGPHGAGLTNVCFCEKGTAVLEMMASECNRPTMGYLAAASGCVYNKIVFNTVWSDPAKNPTYHADMLVDIDQLKATIRQVVL